MRRHPAKKLIERKKYKVMTLEVEDDLARKNELAKWSTYSAM
jgi:hypothetical protein